MAPRIRSIKPEIWQSADFVGLSVLGRLAFVALISNADDEGRLRTDTSHLAKIYLSGAPRLAVEAQLARMEAFGMIVRYQAEGHPCVMVTNWSAHQKVDHPSKSRIPGPPDSPKPREDSRGFAERSLSRARPRTGSDQTGSDRTGSIPDQPARAREAGDNSADGGRLKEPRRRGDMTQLGDVLANVRSA